MQSGKQPHPLHTSGRTTPPMRYNLVGEAFQASTSGKNSASFICHGRRTSTMCTLKTSEVQAYGAHESETLQPASCGPGASSPAKKAQTLTVTSQRNKRTWPQGDPYFRQTRRVVGTITSNGDYMIERAVFATFFYQFFYLFTRKAAWVLFRPFRPEYTCPNNLKLD